MSEKASCPWSAAGGSGPVVQGGPGPPSSAMGGSRRKPAPLLRARTLPAIVTPSLGIIQAQLDAGHQRKGTPGTAQQRQRQGKKKSQGDSCRGSSFFTWVVQRFGK